MQYQNNIFTIRSITNIHAGTKREHFGLIDQYVQRDRYSQLPNLVSHTVKGAVDNNKLGKTGDPNKYMDIIFGKEGKNSQPSVPGQFVFMNADLLMMPVRSNAAPIYHVYCPEVLVEWIDKVLPYVDDTGDMNAKQIEELKEIKNMDTTKIKDNSISISNNINTPIYLEDRKCNHTTIPEASSSPIKMLRKYFLDENQPIALVSKSLMQTLTSDLYLEAIPRNKIGIKKESENLWYEQVVGRESIWGWHYYSPKELSNENQKFKDYLTSTVSKDGKVEPIYHQIGSNFSVGYGVVKFRSLLKNSIQDESKQK